MLLEIRRDPEITVAQFLGDLQGPDQQRQALRGRRRCRALLPAAGGAPGRLRHRRSTRRGPAPAVRDAGREPAAEARRARRRSARKRSRTGPRTMIRGDRPQLLTYTTVDGVVNGDIPIRWEIGFCHLPGASGAQRPDRAELQPGDLTPRDGQRGPAATALAVRQRASRSPCCCTGSRPRARRSTMARRRLALGYGESRRSSDALEKIAKPWIKYRDAADAGQAPDACRTSPSPSA